MSEHKQQLRSRRSSAQFGSYSDLSGIVRGYDFLISTLGVIAALSLLLMPVIITIDVGLRVFKLGSLKWSVDVCEYIMYLSTFLGAPWLMRLGLHVRVDVFVLALPTRFARRFEQFLDLLGATICGVMAWYGALAAIDAHRLDLKQFKAFTVLDWPFHVVFTLSMLLLAVEFLRRLPRPDEALQHDPTVGM
jgi:TRAP-type C4-dicarboxylate transport system permease small subunit